MKVSLITLGCRVNQSESTIIEGTLKENGVTIVQLSEKPDYCIVNTCTVTQRSDYNSRQLIRRAVKAGAKVIVTGCYSHVRPDEVKMLPGVECVCSNDHKDEILKLITGSDIKPSFASHGRSRPYLKVQDGCNFQCSYCTVPAARGRSRSVSLDEVVRRAAIIADNGYQEIVLTGIHLGLYGHDLENKSNIATLVRELILRTRIPRIRLSSLEINEVTDELIELLSDPRMCDHLHLPLQSGSDRILKMMNRNYEMAYFARRISEIIKKVDNVGLGTDIIVGFPGEDDSDFRSTFDSLKSLGFTYAHIFPYSPRPGTVAAGLTNKVHSATITERAAKLQKLNADIRQTFMRRQIGVPMSAIVEDVSVGEGSICTSSNYLKIRVSTDDLKKGSMISVLPYELRDGILRGNVRNSEFAGNDR